MNRTRNDLPEKNRTELTKPLNARLADAIDLVDGLGGKNTTDMFTEISRTADKDLWFVEAHSG